ncbi:MAG: TetR/AcrR family transcriptional regulator [Syntrophorhabdales bacterium]|jgi:AcrR family transcriptional regulator
MLKKRASNGISKSDKKVVTIANAAAKLFSSKGYVATSMEDVAAAAKISKGSIYYYFSTKDEILDYILSTFMDAVLENAGHDLQEIDDPEERIRIMILRHVTTYTGDMYLARTLMQEAHNLPAAKHRKIKVKEREYFRIVFGALSSYLNDEADKDLLTVLTFNLLGMCNWLFSWYDPKKNIDPEQLARLIFDTFMNGLSGFARKGQ